MPEEKTSVLGFRCPLCDEPFYKLAALNYHLRSDHDLPSQEAYEVAGTAEYEGYGE